MKALTLKLSIKIPSTPSDSLLITDNCQNKIDCSPIIDNIYLSGYQQAQDHEYLIKNKFTHIVNCAAGSKRFNSFFFPDIKYSQIQLKDDLSEDIEEAVTQIIRFIDEANRDPSRKILVHCYEGISRGPALLTAYLMWKYCLTKDQALDLIKKKRSCVEINLGFMFQLDKLQQKFEKRVDI